MSKKLIYVEDAIKEIIKKLGIKDESYLTAQEKAVTQVLKDMPSAQPQRMRGKWINVTKTGGAELWKCSECGELELEDSYFCPNCGADMRGEDDV